MIKMSINARRLKRKFEAVEPAVQQLVSEAIGYGFQALVAMTPEDTGFLKASWYQRVGSMDRNHPNPPDAALKATLRYPAGPQEAFTSIYTQQIGDALAQGYNAGAQEGRASNIAISRVTWVNNAPYAQGLDDGSLASGKHAGWATETAAQVAQAMIKGYLGSQGLRLHVR